LANEQNLRPWKPGESGNPAGVNQYTYRREAEKDLDEWCKEYGREMVRVIADAARAGKPWAAKLMLDRILPAVQKHEVDIPEGTEASTLLARLSRIAPARRTNGDGREPEPKRPNGSGGVGT